jgi:hypothetical protein
LYTLHGDIQADVSVYQDRRSATDFGVATSSHIFSSSWWQDGEIVIRCSSLDGFPARVSPNDPEAMTRSRVRMRKTFCVTRTAMLR